MIRSVVVAIKCSVNTHVDDVEVVIHYDPPSDAKTYVHRSGRTARAGESGMVVSLVLWNEELEVRKLLRRLGLKQPIVEVYSNDARLDDLMAWDPAAEFSQFHFAPVFAWREELKQLRESPRERLLK